ncbi:MAG: type I polyketide synthase, partial [Opitutaceae bacterium]
AAFARLAGRAAPASPAGHAAAAAPVVTVEAAPAPVTAVAAASGDIAIIGVAGRYPGAENLEDFWRLLREGREAVTEVPAERWDVNAFHDPDPARAIDGKSYGRWGAFLRDVDRFDPLFFHLSPVEAEMMDPQERLFLEVAWHALEDAGWTRRDLARARRAEYAANVGVFAGVTSNPYALLGHPGGGHAAPTSLPWSLANRVSYLFNFNGPSLPVDTACSSSLTAIHLAVQAIRRGECQQALAGGVNLYLHPAKFSHLSLMQMLSRDGHCRAFGAGADGFVPGEGCGVVLLKPLALARADGDRIHGVIRATAVNHGGRTNGYTVPSPIAQAELVGRALREGGVEPASVSYIEAHGTGTALGDPVEVEGLARAFTGGRPATPWCALGSVKANIGHLESAAGMAGLTKVLLQFRHRELVPSLHAEPPNPRINFAVTPFRVPHRVEAWTSVGPRRAGISSFGAGGAHAHVIVEEPPAAPPAPPAAAAAPQVIVLSARTRDRLQASAGRLADFLAAAEPPPSLAEVAWTLQVGREAREERVAWVATDHAGLLATLRALAADEEPAGVALVRGRVRRERLAAEGAEAPGVEVREPHAAAARWAAGEEILWAALHATPARRIGLPGYPFARERCWLPLPPAVPPAPAPEPAAAPVPAAGETTFTIADARLRDHRVQGRPVLPGAVALELLRRPPGGPPAGELRRITWARPVAGDDAVTVRGRWRPAGEGWTLELTVPADEALLVQAHAVAAASLPPASDPDHAARCPEEVPGAGLYAAFAARGIDYGPAFQVLTRIRRGPDTALAELALPAAWPAGTPALPAYVDGALQALAVLGAGDGGLEVPFALDAYAAADAPVPTRAVAEVTRRAGGGDGITRYDVVLRGPDGAWVASLRGVGLRPVAAEPVAETLLLRPTWKPAPPLPPAPAGPVLVRGGPRADAAPGGPVPAVPAPVPA